jgi:hypothetical protein
MRTIESGGKYNIKGASGENGAYQFMPATWKAWAGKHLGDPNAPMTAENQNFIAYQQVKGWKDEGLTPYQILSKWNSGGTNYEGKVGVNKMGVKYDVPAYVSRGMTEFQKEVVKLGGRLPTASPSVIPPPAPTAASTPQPTLSTSAKVRSLLPNLNQSEAIVNDMKTIGKDAAQTGRDIGERALGAQKQGIGSTILQGLGLGAKVAGEVAFGLPAKMIGRMVPDAQSAPIKAAAGKAVAAVVKTPRAQNVIGEARKFAADHPVAAANLGAAGNIAGTFLGAGTAKEASTLTQSGLKSSTKALAKVTTRNAERAAANELTKTLELTRPVLNKAEKEAALAAGRGQTGSILKADTIVPDARDIERAAVVHDFIATARDENEAIQRINAIIATKSEVIKTGLKQSGDPIFNKSQLRSYIVKFAKSPERQVLLAGDDAAKRAYEGILDTFMRVVDKHPKNVSGLLNARKEFDRIAEAGMKNVFGDGVQSARKQAILDIRRLANEYIEDQIPVGDAMKAVLRQQTLLYEAAENIAARKARNVGTNRFTQFIKRHPTATKIGGAAVGGTVLGAAGRDLLGL